MSTSPQESPVRAESAEPVLEVRDLRVHFPASGGRLIRAVDGVSFDVAAGTTFGIVGESGCGKSTTARALLNLVPITGGSIKFRGEAIHGASAAAMRTYRQKLQIVFQDPFASLNPRMTVGRIISEPLRVYGMYDRRRRQLEVMRLMDLVGLNPRYLNRYPHEFSGGQRQRIGIARALALEPELIVCDEPVSALDVSIQAQVVNLLMDLQEQLGLAYVFIAHDISIVRHVADRIAVMYLGRIVEVADADELCEHPRHPYTQALLSAVPIADPQQERARRRIQLVGEIPTPDREYVGCRFADRCPIVESACRESSPQLGDDDDHQVACFLA